jgi:uncharacterized membrane protein YagU involved in acid resistance
VVLGALTVGLLDALDAMIFFGFRGVPPVRILQSIASGLLGPAAYQGGAATTALGTLLHFGIAFAVVLTYAVVSRRAPLLTRHPLVCGAAYGLLVYAVMNLVVLPLSAASTVPRTLPVVVNGLLIHMLGVGAPSVLFARAAANARHR